MTKPILISPYSTLGQGLETSTYPGEVIFSIALAIFGLILFALLIGNMQVRTPKAFGDILDLYLYIIIYILELLLAIITVNTNEQYNLI